MFNPNVFVKKIVTQPQVAALVTLISRALLIYLFLNSGWGKIFKYDAVVQHMVDMGVPGWMLPLVILLEVGGGIAFLFGFQTRLVAFWLAVYSILSGLIFHASPEDAIHLMKNLGLGGGFFFVMVMGPGRWSLDRLIEKE
ncbi:DoxX family protein [Neisseria montereyensis]|uniref:DoxX family protein n=1 Tax=Neisseria montereyensis TaxID=2973938 RepID=A0ABT2FAH0_9NEIS|nr:DoxX family protein [Neisseria montereyensis]MCS4532940.1 DoxX family protein [Neisseria montereyensis]